MSFPAKGSIVVSAGDGKVATVTPVDSQYGIFISDAAALNGARFVKAPRYFTACDSTGNINASSGFVPITWNVEDRKDTDVYGHTTGSSDISFLEAGNYKIILEVSTYMNSGSSRSSSQVRLTADTGSGFIEIPNTESYMYNRNADNGYDSCTVTKYYTASAGTILRAEVRRVSGSGTILTQPGSCRIFIESIII